VWGRIDIRARSRRPPATAAEMASSDRARSASNSAETSRRPGDGMAVGGHFVAFPGDGADQFGLPFGDVAEHEERGATPAFRSRERMVCVLRVTRLS
jgi:hypothetical protein